MKGSDEIYIGQLKANVRALRHNIALLKDQLAKPRLPWRKVSEGEKPEEGRQLLIFDGNGLYPATDLLAGDTHWCYADELRPGDEE